MQATCLLATSSLQHETCNLQLLKNISGFKPPPSTSIQLLSTSSAVEKFHPHHITVPGHIRYSTAATAIE